MIDLDQLRASIAQSLESFQRCGLTHLPRQLDLPAALRDQIAAARAPAASSPPSRGNSAMAAIATPTTVATSSPRPQPAAEPTVSSVGQMQPVTEVPVAARQPVATARVEIREPTPWNLPVLSDGERQTQFDALRSKVQACQKCTEIVCYRQQIVFGTGPLRPTVVFMGEAPGADEDKQGVPFVGRAGQLLTKIIEAMQLKRDEVYILNALKCRPPQNRTPVPEEIEHCRPFVETQLDVLQPKYIVCLGAVAVRSLLGLANPVGGLRGRFHQYRQSQVVVTYHPSYLLRNESAKRLVWQDMQMLMRELGISVPTKKSDANN